MFWAGSHTSQWEHVAGLNLLFCGQKGEEREGQGEGGRDGGKEGGMENFRLFYSPESFHGACEVNIDDELG